MSRGGVKISHAIEQDGHRWAQQVPNDAISSASTAPLHAEKSMEVHRPVPVQVWGPHSPQLEGSDPSQVIQVN